MKKLILGTIIVLSLSICSCGTKSKVTGKNETSEAIENVESSTDEVIKEEIQEETVTEEIEETSEVKEEIPASEIINMTTEGYSSMESIKIWSEFEVETSEELVDGVGKKNITITGEYPLSKGCIADSIVITSDDTISTYIEINGVKKQFGGIRIYDAEIIDIDREDEYNEVVVYDHGASADPTIHIFRFVDNSIVEIGSFGAKYTYDEILFNGKGRIIGGKDYLFFLDTEIVTEFTEVKDDVVNTYHPGYTELLDKKYTLSEDIEVEFSGEPNLTDPTYMYNRTKIEEGTEIKLLEINLDKDLYYISYYMVELPDGSVKKMYIPFGD
ncbi:MAG: hypothetical protein IJA34_12665 [Lachnospiraceae bacterium]|nr:hypothetical protein [Lachnospiraceae bacterium]